ncbi:MAG: DMT family transporter [Nitrosomonadales bacterium]|nr:DMT family transporter [Nitrosomonadales bacterium]
MGALWMLAAGFLFGCMGVFVKLGAQYFSHNELVFYRSFVGLLMIYAIVRHRGLPLATRHWQPHLWRSVSGTIAMMLFFYCITVLPLATAVTLNYTSPLFLTILTMLVFGERFHAPLTFAIAVGFAGMVLLLQPTLERDQFIPGLLGLISGLLAGVAMLNVRQLGLHGEPDWRVVFYFSLVASLASGGAMLFDAVHPVGANSLLILIGLGGSATLAQLAMTRAYRTGKMLVVGSLSFSTVLFSSLFGMAFWGEALPLAGWAGIALIVASGVLSLRLAPRHPEE